MLNCITIFDILLSFLYMKIMQIGVKLSPDDGDSNDILRFDILQCFTDSVQDLQVASPTIDDYLMAT